MTVAIGGELEAAEVVAVAGGAPVSFGDDARARVRSARAVIDDAVAGGETIYGVTTGFGALAHTRVEPSQASTLQHGIVRSHATAVGVPLPRDEARAMLLLRAHVLALGHSGVRPEIVDLMVSMLNEDVIPAVPQQGSLGASGDLAPLANLALPLIGHGEVLSPEGGVEPAAGALGRAGLAPITLEAKEGLALVNGTQGMLAIGILATERAAMLARTADVVAAMTIEASLGTDRPFDERLQKLRPHPGQMVSASNLRRLLADSPILASHRDSHHLVQDAYSLRCAPQVHGATRDALAYACEVLRIEANSVSDNPIVLVDGGSGEVVSGGNFHGQPVAVALDAAATALVSLASISERRLYRLLDEHLSNGLPPFLVHGSGLNSGFMLVQYTAASLVSESKSLAHPPSVDSIPSSAGQEDHVSMGMTSARHAREVLANAETVIALEALGAAQALDLRAPLQPGPATRAAHAAIRERVPFFEADREFGPDIAQAVSVVRGGRLVAAAETASGPVD
ncbi:MAG: histidine ammonia-lyase [Actinomycetota bacterium]|nr:histidine ammonia-lyase [Actinomycetota bacterium]MDH5223674.1 histidine ammonia-lyase [Actinomycetota bacterium]